MSQDPNSQKFETVPLGTYLRRVRQSRGLQLKDLAAMANTTPALISRLETGAARPTLFAVVKICTALGLDLESLSEVIGVTSFMTEARKQRAQQVGGRDIALSIEDVEQFLDLYHKNSAKAQEKLVGLHAENPKKGTDTPTTERLLKAFNNITLTTVHLPAQVVHHVTPLTALQTRILELLGLSPTIYSALAAN